MVASVVARVFGAIGIPLPSAPAIVRAFARCPRDRLIRVVAWYAWECARGIPSDHHLSEGIRLLARGWDDFYATMTLPSGAFLVSIEASPRPGTALVTRRKRMGRGWHKESVSTLGSVRSEVTLSARWIHSVIGCITHDDCAAIPELGLACAMSSFDGGD